MGELTPEKLRWVVQAKRRGEGTADIAWAMGVSQRRVQQVLRHVRMTGELPVFKRPGRPKKAFTMGEVDAILEAHQAYDVGALLLERILVAKGTKISKNRIHNVLKAAKKAEADPKKQKRRKWVRYERDHSMQLWHTDWKLLPNGNWFIAFMDDASRYILNYGEFPERNQENVFVVLDEAIRRFGCPDEILTDRGSEFYTNAQEGKTHGVSKFTRRLEELGIKHIVARVNHPQTNGKLERFHGEIDKRWERWDGDVRKIVDWHNHLKPHMSLRFNRAERPAQAFVRKYPAERVLENVASWFWR